MGELAYEIYEALASEYYDPERHPTCANFSEASRLLLSEWLRRWPGNHEWICEVGPGRSLSAELLGASDTRSLSRLMLVDVSPSMLAHSRKWSDRGVRLVVGDARRLPLGSNSLSAVVSSLGDFYNEHTFWEEVARVLRPGGVCVFTTPSYEWARGYRGPGRERLTLAEFVLGDGRRIGVPSWIYPVEEQVAVIEESGLRTKEVTHVPIAALRMSRLSPKLLPERGSSASVVTGYFVVKMEGAGGRDAGARASWQVTPKRGRPEADGMA